jgi:hypothetical protein
MCLRQEITIIETVVSVGGVNLVGENYFNQYFETLRQKGFWS